jgi:hypothetical protein
MQTNQENIAIKTQLILTALCVLSTWQIEAQIYDTNNVVVQTFAGSGFSGLVDGVGQQTMFNNPQGVVADTTSNLFILDSGNSRIRKITPDGTVSTFAGGDFALSGLGGALSIAIDHSNTLWIASFYYGDLERVGSDGSDASIYWSGLGRPWGVCVDSQNNVYVSDHDHQLIWRRKSNGVAEVFVGSGNTGSADGNGVFTSFNSPAALTSDAADNIYVWDSGNLKIRRINQNRDVVTITGGSATSTDGQYPSFSAVSSMCVDGVGNLILACGASVRKMPLTTNGVTLAGSFTQTGYTNGAGNLARFNGASGVCVSHGMIYVADTRNQRIRSITNNPTAQVVSPANLQLNTYPGLQIIGTVGRTYQIQASPDLNSWSTKATILLNSSPYVWIDLNPVSGNNFYRALMLP